MDNDSSRGDGRTGRIAGAVGVGARYAIIYKANREQIRSPN
jgi:hypothetical protein